MSTRNNISPLQKRRLNFLRTVKVFFKKHPEHFKDVGPPTIQMISEESKMLRTYMLCHLPNRFAKFVGKVKGEKILLAEVMVGNEKLYLG